LPVKQHHRDADVRLQSRICLSPFRKLQRILRENRILVGIAHYVHRLRRLRAPSISVFSTSHQHKPSRLDGEPLTIVSANLWHDWPRYRHLPQRLESFAQLIEEQGAQVVLLQEALRNPQLSASDWLAERLSMAHGYVRANGEQHAIGFEEGPAVLTSLPLQELKTLELGSTAGSFVRRMAIAARLELGCCHLWVVSTHLDFFRCDNRRQIERLRTWVSDLVGGEAALIGGDFNADEHSKGIQDAREQWQDTYRSVYPEGESSTHALRWPWGGILRRHRLDYLFLQNGDTTWRVMDAQHLMTEPQPHSDHKAVLARLRHECFPTH
jgi:endonuclease/exonuclease/phosphatase family metal-dependent hydrolase